jgi:hypothetical protein
LVLFPGKGDADNVGGLFIKRIGFEIKTERFFPGEFGDELRAACGVISAKVAIRFLVVFDCG